MYECSVCGSDLRKIGKNKYECTNPDCENEDTTVILEEDD